MRIAGVANLLLVSAASNVEVAGVQGSTSSALSAWASIFRAFVKLVLGTGPRLWLKVSLLGIMMRVNPFNPAIGPLKIAIACSFWHVAQIAYPLYRDAIKPTVDLSLPRGRCALLSAVGITLTVPIWGSAVRLAGVVLCSTHQFNLSHGCVE